MNLIRVDAAAIATAATVTKAQIAAIETEVAKLTANLTSLEASWSGAAATAFQGALGSWRSAQATVESSLAELNRVLEMASTQYAEVEAANARLFGAWG
ncbi:MAG: WXG100 family type VII secretion target [Microbacteriaceae bacterium]|nr:WXG100 family type VII secretion target [Microbacteriaceae bacterium]